MNILEPLNLLPVILIASLTSGTTSIADNSAPRVNPFELPHGIYSKDNAPLKQQQSLKLQAIFNINGKHIATISGENFTKGDIAFGKRVVNIFDNRVVLDAGGKEEILALEKTKFQIRKNN